jgi:hypothetical protein
MTIAARIRLGYGRGESPDEPEKSARFFQKAALALAGRP